MTASRRRSFLDTGAPIPARWTCRRRCRDKADIQPIRDAGAVFFLADLALLPRPRVRLVADLAQAAHARDAARPERGDLGPLRLRERRLRLVPPRFDLVADLFVSYGILVMAY